MDNTNAYPEASDKDLNANLTGKGFKFEIGAQVFAFDGDKKIVPGKIVARYMNEHDPKFKMATDRKEKLEEYRVASDFIDDFYRYWRQAEHVEANATDLLHCFLATKEVET
jgi:hypothetical protein